jgi:hypothetical protein
MKDALKSISVGVRALLGGASARAVRALAAGLILIGACTGADAFDFFGLFGSEAPPPISTTALSYAVTITVTDGDNSLANAVMDASSLYKLRRDAPPDGDSLARRATRDFAPLNVITAGGVTSGIDFALNIVAEIAGNETAQAIQLGIEYDPAPLFTTGHPARAPAWLTALVASRNAKAREAYRAILQP